MLNKFWKSTNRSYYRGCLTTSVFIRRKKLSSETAVHKLPNTTIALCKCNGPEQSSVHSPRLVIVNFKNNKANTRVARRMPRPRGPITAISHSLRSNFPRDTGPDTLHRPRRSLAPAPPRAIAGRV
ncbi:hypothetical protein EVAR_44918_1 [Eumeta japonica]|uniref:Uncharacterized protein n=1 Tax=Eumeta variegata TaxID=151549 RepID=A0A4C1XIT9_EUMVA|nr:hypothetical protein EVAR_44918_1 [Eumeta japonica]